MKGKRLAEWAEILGISGQFEGIITGTCSDSREVGPGKVFFALKGERVDGHDFLAEVAQKGALAAVISETYQGEAFGLQLFRVKDVVDALQMLAKSYFSKSSAQVVAVTGSVGKTTTKEFIATLLAGKFRVAKTPGNSNSQVGVPLSILNTEEDPEVFVFEMGMSAPQELKKLVAIAPPDLAVVTKIGLSHAAYFPGGIEEIAAAKAEIFSHPRTKLALIHAEAAHFQAFSHLSCERLLFGWENPAYAYALQKRENGLFLLEKGQRGPSLHPPFQASHLLENFSTALAVARSLGLSWQEIENQIPHLRPFKRRFERVEREGIVFINDSYNASPESMRAALVNLPQPEPGCKRIAVFGEMKELGEHTEQAHRTVALCALDYIDHLLCFGKGCLSMMEIFTKQRRPAEYFDNFTLLQQRLQEFAQAGDVVLIKGSNSNALWRLLD